MIYPPSIPTPFNYTSIYRFCELFVRFTTLQALTNSDIKTKTAKSAKYIFYISLQYVKIIFCRKISNHEECLNDETRHKYKRFLAIT